MAISKRITKPLTPAQREKARVRRKAWRAANAERERAKSKAYELANAEKIAARMAAYCVRHAERLRARRTAYALANAEKIRQRQAAYYVKNAERKRKRTATWQIENPEKRHAYKVAHYAANAPQMRTYSAAWKIANPEAVRVHNTRRRARKAGAPLNDFTAAQWRAMQEACKHRCVYCGKLAKGHLTQDHLTPLAKGGSHTLTNILPACRSCNSQKGLRAVPIPVQAFLLITPLGTENQKAS